jgi:hypothetical protein
MSLTFDFPNWQVGIGDQQQQAKGQQQQERQQQQEWAADLAVSCMLLACVCLVSVYVKVWLMHPRDTPCCW